MTLTGPGRQAHPGTPRRRSLLRRIAVPGTGLLALLPAPALAAATPGSVPGLVWGLPFLGMLLSIGLMPMLAERLWHRRMGLIAFGWTLGLVLPLAATAGAAAALAAVWHAVLIEYLPFVVLLVALFTTGGGILIRGGPAGRPGGNTAMLALGIVLAGIMGTTGAAMVLIHPLLRANAHRRRRLHLVIFFIVLVANVGGATTPLGDPPLYLGFLHGIPFQWPLVNLLAPLLVVALPLLGAFYLLDRRLAASEGPPPPPEKIAVTGAVNIALLGVVVATVLGQGLWRPGPVSLFGQPIGLERLVGLAVLGAVTLVSLQATPRAVRQGNLFTWEPMPEVVKLFAALFVTIIPVLGMLEAGFDGPLAPMLRLTLDVSGQPVPVAYFWLTGILSAFLDNAPTYLVFFELAGGDPARLTGDLAPVLRAISAGAVFFGGLTYIGNAPNLMVRAIASRRGVRMPGFFGYMLWSACLLGPTLLLVSLVFFR